MNYETALEPDPPQTSDLATAEGGPQETAAAHRKRQVRRIALIGLALVLGALALVWGRSGPPPAEAPQLPVVSVIVPGTTAIAGVVEVTGTLAARRAMPVGSVGEGGRVVSVPVEAGQWVKAGQVLAVIDRAVQNQQILSSDAQLDAARADARLAEANLQRALQLVERGFISQADVDRLTATRDAAAARVGVAAAQLGEMRARTARLDIIAPASGLLLTREVEPGQVVSGGSGVLFMIAQGGQLELLAQLSEEDLAGLSVGTTAEVTPVGSARSFTGQIWQVPPTIDPQTRQGTARIALAYAPELRPGGFASATIRSGTVRAPLLPESAILSDDKGAYVLVLGKDDAVERRAVTTGLVTARGIAIASGLTGTERVVLRAGGFLAPGDRIEPLPAKWPAP